MSGAIGGNFSLGDAAGGALGGAAEGAAIGSVVPGIGTAIGAVGGALGGIVQGLIGSRGASAQNAANQIIAAEQVDAQRESQSNAQAFADAEAAKAENYNTQMSIWQEEMAKQNMQLGYNYNSALQQRQMDYETQMSNTAYQRSVADMKAAGLNPILGVSSGGASTPSVGAPGVGNPGGPSTPGAPSPTSSAIPGASIPMVNAKAQLAQGLGDAFTSAAKVGQVYQAFQQGAANIAQTQANTSATNADTALKTAQLPEAQQRALASQLLAPQAQQALDNARADLNRIHSATSLNQAQAVAAGASADASEARSALDRANAQKLTEAPPGVLPGSSWLGSAMDYFTGRLKQATDAISNLQAPPGGHSGKANSDIQIQSIIDSRTGQPLYNAIPQ